MAITPSGKDKLTRYNRIFVAEFDLSGDARSFDSADYMAANQDIEISGWNEEHENFIADGRTKIGIRNYQAIMNDAAARSFGVLKDAPNNHVVSLLFGGGGAPATGDPAYIMSSVQMMDMTRPDGGKLVINTDFVNDSAQLDVFMQNPLGWVLANEALTATDTGLSVDMIAQFTNGVQANLHVVASDGGTWEFKIQDSANDSAWADYATFTADGSVITSERLTSGDTIDQFIRLLATRTSGTVTIVCSLAVVRII